MSVEARFPERLLDEAKALVKEGWFQDLDSVLQEALGATWTRIGPSRSTDSFGRT